MLLLLRRSHFSLVLRFLFVVHLFTFSYLCFARKAAHIFYLLTPTHFYLRDLFLLVFRLFPLHFAFLKSFGSELWIYYAQAFTYFRKRYLILGGTFFFPA